jgi:diguanylate cyclase (GGDEF)-like protein
MGHPRFLTLFALVVAMLAFGLAPSAARATGPALCNAPDASSSAAAFEALPASAWQCQPGRLDLDAQLNVIRLEVAEGSEPRFVISRAAKFSAISLGVVRGEAVTWSHHDFDTVEATFFDRQVAMPLPDYATPPDAVLVAVDGVTQQTTVDYLRLEEQLPGSNPGDVAMLIVVALFTGMMLMPILFDIVFYRVLRDKFILWHAALVGCLAVQLVCNFGLYTAFVSVTLPMVRVITIGSFTLMVITATVFSLKFIEPQNVPRRIARILVAVLGIFAVISVVHMAGIEALGRWPATAYFTFGGPVAAALIALLVTALRKGSRTVIYLLVGLSPLVAVGLVRVVSFMIPGVPTMDANELMLAATIIEVTATALGVASRFLSLKLDRDRAHAEADMLEGEAQRDALTGLLNRRVMDNRYGELRAQGFDTFALIDLDKFKDVNDRFGHQTGDAVLVACANAIRCEGDRDTIALRLGGEEFVLLLRGKRATERAEALRLAIPRRIAADVPHLDRLVTASMGVLELPRDALNLMEFEEIYARADKLLYEAKASGRNRKLYERLKVFDAAHPPATVAA